MIVNKASVTALEKAFIKIFTDALHGGSASPMHPKFANRFPNTAAALDLSWMAAIPGMRKMQGAAQVNNLEVVNWVIPNDEFEDTIGVKVKDLERDQLGLYNERFKLLGDAAARHPDELLAQVMLAGFTNKDYTGKNFFDTAKKHFPTGKSAFTNKLTTVLAPESFKEARTALKTSKIVFPDNSETQLNLGRELTLVVSPSNEDAALAILSAERLENGATNTLRNAAKLEVWGYLGDSPAWFLMDTGHAMKPFAFSDEKPTTVVGCTNPEDSHVIKHKEYIYQAYGRYAVGYLLPQLIIGSTGADDIEE
jgi:phage major head subunit gpT-like protein